MEGRIVAHQNQEALPGRLVEAVLLFEFLDEFRIEPLAAAVARGDVGAGAGGAADGAVLIGVLQLRDRPLHRAARDELHDGERHQHDAEQRRDHQEKAANQIAQHGDPKLAAGAFMAVSARLPIGGSLAVIPAKAGIQSATTRPPSVRHSRNGARGRDDLERPTTPWIPAFAGMTLADLT